MPKWEPSKEHDKTVGQIVVIARLRREQWAQQRAAKIMAESSPMSGRYAAAYSIANQESEAVLADALRDELLDLVDKGSVPATSEGADYLAAKLRDAAGSGLLAVRAETVLRAEVSKIAIRPLPPLATRIKEWVTSRPWVAIPSLIFVALSAVAGALKSLNVMLEEGGKLCARVEGSDSLVARVIGLICGIF